MIYSSSFSNSDTYTCYHYCSYDFFEELKSKRVIYADDRSHKFDKMGNSNNIEPISYAKEYLFREKKINNGNGMFFAWTNPDYKGNIVYLDKPGFVLLKLEVPTDSIIKTDYENWCSFGLDIYDADGDLHLADVYCRNSGIPEGLEGSYKSIFNIKDPSEVQILLNKLSLDWVVDFKYVERKFI